MKNPFISIVIPTLNEEGNIGSLIKEIKIWMEGKKYEIIIVDGNSKDNTVEVAKKLGVKVMSDSRGKGSALIKGLSAAKGDVVISMDADLSHEPKELMLLIDSINIGYDVCMGSRFIAGGGSEDISFIRIIGNKFFVYLVNFIFRSNYSDMCYGYRSFRKDIINQLDLKEMGFGIETEINIKAIKNHLKIMEVPSTEKKRNLGEGKLNTFRDGYVILKTILKNAL